MRTARSQVTGRRATLQELPALGMRHKLIYQRTRAPRLMPRSELLIRVGSSSVVRPRPAAAGLPGPWGCRRSRHLLRERGDRGCFSLPRRHQPARAGRGPAAGVEHRHCRWSTVGGSYHLMVLQSAYPIGGRGHAAQSPPGGAGSRHAGTSGRHTRQETRHKSSCKTCPTASGPLGSHA